MCDNPNLNIKFHISIVAIINDNKNAMHEYKYIYETLSQSDIKRVMHSILPQFNIVRF